MTQECLFPNFKRSQTEKKRGRKKKRRKNKKSVLDVLAGTKCPASSNSPACLGNRASSRSNAVILVQA